jgi:hypothetical protein
LRYSSSFIKPASCRSWAFSRIDSTKLLIFLAIINRLYPAALKGLAYGRLVCIQPDICCRSQRKHFIGANILPVAFGKRREKHRQIPRPKGNDGAVSARPSLALPRDALLDEAAAQIGVNQAALCAFYCLAQTGVHDLFVPGKPREPLRFEDPNLVR